MDTIKPLAYTSIQAILQITFTCGFGFVLMRKNIITKDMQKGLAALNVCFFTPCLLFTKMASNATFDTYVNMWPIPVIYFTLFFLSSIIAFIGSKVLRLPPPMRRFITLATLFSNSNSLPISLIQTISLSPVALHLRWGEDDTPEMIQARGITYIMVFAAVSNIVRWSYGVSLIKSMGDDKLESASAGTPNPEAGYESDVSETTPLIVNSDNSSEMIAPVTFRTKVQDCLIDFGKTLKAIFNPPLIAIFAAFFVSAIPQVKALFYGPNPLFGALSRAVAVCSGAAIPAVLIGLGCNISLLIRESRRVSFRMVSMVVASRFVIVPAIAISLLLALRNEFTLGDDPTFILVMMILISSPTAINLLQVCQSVDKFEDEMSMLLLYSYLLAIPVMTGLVTFFLYLIQKLNF